jgi:hypothetical protein
MSARPCAALRQAVHQRGPHAWSYPMTTLSNFHNDDTSQDGAWEKATLVLGALTIVAVIVVMVFAST